MFGKAMHHNEEMPRKVALAIASIGAAGMSIALVM
jgi:hypothetical protein